MRRRALVTLTALAVVAPLLAGGGAARASEQRVDAAQLSRGITMGTSVRPSTGQVEEGRRYRLTATIKSPARASRIRLLKWTPPWYVGDTGEWEPVRGARVRGRRLVTFTVVATGLNTERHRVSVAYRNGRTVQSKPVSVKVWRWIPLSDYDPYYETSGTSFGEAMINGHRYKAWGASAYSNAGAWEARFTPGRHCKAFRGVLGVADMSADGSSAEITFLADDQVVFGSAALVPGMAVRVQKAIALPYRFAIQLTDTSPEGAQSWPVIGDPAFLCTGV